MPGPFSFLPLSNKPGLKSRVQAKTDEPNTSKTTLPEHRKSSTQTAQGVLQDKDDEWYDTGSSEGVPTPVKQTKKANVSRSVKVTVKKISVEDEVKLVPYMPALFCTDLPPCGLEGQVGYEIVNGKLRDRWLNGLGRLSALQVCEAVKDELRQQNYMWPPYSVKGKFKRRKPWCRESVFKHQLEWIDYYLREAQMQAPELLTESEIMDRKKDSSIPPELKLNVDRRDVLKLWDEWNEKKRAKTPVMPEAFMESDPDVGVPDAEVKQEANKETKEVQSVASEPTDSSGETIGSAATDGSAVLVENETHSVGQ
ncbi:hypothetical protein K491DRAFT_693568 [Lophiostoma macrostomum CBS 122681]|uniref:Uncharacterized protein n=1 Tax=Lophiostoma macrostomum CBS 122681 TaxID=1314788 RepID=A0A6A6T427_9PLEO|nr:hypothetical protein K491DRAFT_693568 [Lophiostoma macrostomum CBS 122681]